MIIQIFRPPNDGETLRECKLGDINDAVSLEYEDYFCGVGTFTLEMLSVSPFAQMIGKNTLLYSKDDDITFVVKNIKENEHEYKLTVTGYTLNCMLLDRLTMERENDVDGAEGKDVFSGTTEACVKHFVDYNMISSPDKARNYARFAVADDKGRGIAQDSNLVGMECVENVVRTMCEAAKLGYRIKMDISVTSPTEPLFIFDVAERVDRSAEQSERNRVIFSVGRKNITALEREVGISAEKNAVWCETGGENGFVFKNDDENGEPVVPVSWDRREEYISLSVTDTYNWDEIELFARKEMADKFAEVDSLTVEAGNPLEYGVLYSLGDIVTVWDKEKSLQLDSWISAVAVKRTATEYSVKLTLGESKPKLLDGYAKQTDILKKNQRDFPAADNTGGTGGDTIEHAIIIEEQDVKHLIHSYTTVDYFHGNRLVYAGVQNQVVCNGAIFHANSSSPAAAIEYGSLSFERAKYDGTVQNVAISIAMENYNESSGVYNCGIYINGNRIGGFSTKTLTYGFQCRYTTLSSAQRAGSDYPYGNVTCTINVVHYNTNGNITSAVVSGISAVGFISTAEYNSAVGLTTEPVVGETIEETVTTE